MSSARAAWLGSKMRLDHKRLARTLETLLILVNMLAIFDKHLNWHVSLVEHIDLLSSWRNISSLAVMARFLTRQQLLLNLDGLLQVSNPVPQGSVHKAITMKHCGQCADNNWASDFDDSA